jgi:excisionase family DNA binding protein
MADKACPSKRQNCADAKPDKLKLTGGAGSSMTVEKDCAPSTPETSGRTPAIVFTAGKHDASVRHGQSHADFPAWAVRQHGDAKPREEIASPVAGQPHANSALFAPLMTVSETATILHVSPRTIRRMIKRGELNPARIGRSIRIRSEDIRQIVLGIASG